MKRKHNYVLIQSALMLLALTNLAMSDSIDVVKVPSHEIFLNLSRNETIEYNNVIIEGDLDFKKSMPIYENGSSAKIMINSSINIENSSIEGIVDLSSCIFNSPISFTDTYFNQSVLFRNSILQKNVSFLRCCFNDTIDCSNAMFQRIADLSDTQFNGSASFNRSEFKRCSLFQNSHFNKKAFFELARFGEKADFINSFYGGIAYFNSSYYYDDASFGGSNFAKNAYFRDSKFQRAADFHNSYFAGSTSFRESKFLSSVYFNGTKFSKSADFVHCWILGSAFFYLVNFGNDIELNSSEIIGDVIFEKSSFSGNVYIYQLKFTNFKVEWDKIKNILYADGQTYFNLINNFKRMGLSGKSGAIDCYYRYKKEILIENQRSNWLEFIGNYLQWIAWGFGVRPSYAFSTSLCVIVLFGIFYGITKSIDTPKIPRAIYQHAIFISLILFFIMWGYLNCTLNIFLILLCTTIFVIIYLFGRSLVMDRITNNILFSFYIFFAFNPIYYWRKGAYLDFIILLETIMGWLVMAIFLGSLVNISWPFSW